MAVIAPLSGRDALLKIVCPSATAALVPRALPVLFFSFPLPLCPLLSSPPRQRNVKAGVCSPFPSCHATMWCHGSAVTIYTFAGGRNSSCSLLLNRGGATEERLPTFLFLRSRRRDILILVPIDIVYAGTPVSLISYTSLDIQLRFSSRDVSHYTALCLLLVATQPQECLYPAVITTRQGPFNAKGGVLFRCQRKTHGSVPNAGKMKIILVAPWSTEESEPTSSGRVCSHLNAGRGSAGSNGRPSKSGPGGSLSSWETWSSLLMVPGLPRQVFPIALISVSQ